MPKRERLSKTASGDHFIRRDAKGRIKEEVSAGKAVAQDRRVKAKTVVKPGEGDRGDVKPRAKKPVEKVARKTAPAKKK